MKPHLIARYTSGERAWFLLPKLTLTLTGVNVRRGGHSKRKVISNVRWIHWQFGKPRYSSQPKQWFVWLWGLFLEWNSDGFELSYYRSPGELCAWKWTRTKSGRPIQDDTRYRTNA